MTAQVDSFRTSDGTELALHWQGPDDAALTLVLAHGWTLDSRCWAPVADLVAARAPGVRVLSYDHRGHGGSDPARPQDSNIAQLADDLAELLRAEVSGPVVLAGHSMGGMTIMALAERHADLVAARVRGAVFAATSCGDLARLDLGLRPWLSRCVAVGERLLLRFGWLIERFRRARVTAKRPGLIRYGVRWLLFGEHPRAADVALTARVIAEGRPANLVDFRPTFNDHERAAALPAFGGVPTVVLGGTLDRMTPFRHSEAIARELPGAELVRYSGIGHMVPLECAADVAERISAMLDKVAADRQEPGQAQRAG